MTKQGESGKAMSVPIWSQQRVAIVTGDGSGIGAAVSERLAADGAAVAVFDLDGGSAAKTASAIEAAEGAALAVACDVADRGAIETGVAETVERLGRLFIERPDREFRPNALLGLQSRSDRLDQVAGSRIRPQGHHRRKSTGHTR